MGLALTQVQLLGPEAGDFCSLLSLLPPKHPRINLQLRPALSSPGDPCPTTCPGLPGTPVSLWRSQILPGSLLPALSLLSGPRLCLQLISACLHELGT